MSNRIKQSIKLKRPKAGKLVGFIGAFIVLAIGVYCSITLCSCESGTSVSADIEDLSNLAQAVLNDDGNTESKNTNADNIKNNSGSVDDSNSINSNSNSVKSNSDIVNNSNSINNNFNTTEEVNAQKITVFVCGAVNSPGVYEFESDSRVVDAIEMAGGFTSDACVDYLNQAEKLTDSVRIYVPTSEEVKNGTVLYPEISSGSSVSGSNQNTVNINTADKNLLMTLPGIGEAKAGSIIKYRDSKGAFSSIEEIKNVEGIKDGIFEQLKDLISV